MCERLRPPMSEGCIVMHHTTPERTPFDSSSAGARRGERVGKVGDAPARNGTVNTFSQSNRGTFLFPRETQPQQHPNPPGLVTDNEASDLGHVSSLEEGLSSMHNGESGRKLVARPKREYDDDEHAGSTSTPDFPSAPQHEINLTLVEHKQKGMLLDRLTESSKRGRLTLINLSQRFLSVNDSLLIKNAIRENPQLSVLKLSYNNLGDEGAIIIAQAMVQDGVQHKSLSLLDLGFNGIGDKGCAALALQAVAGNLTLQKLYLAGNQIREEGAIAIAGAILHGCGLVSLHLTANKLGPVGIKALAGAIAERDARPVVSDSSEVTNRIKTVEEFYCGNTNMESSGFMQLSSMLLSNSNLRILSLSNNGVDDRDMALLAQALTRNKEVPLKTLQLSFNEISCVGVECLMNAVWGSKTLREIKLDNNKVRDRGAQLCAVVLTSIDLEVLDLGFNKITTVGVRALMKSISENSSLRSLTISGLPLDINASKAVSYALAYNCSLRVFHADNCSVGYSAQRHIVAGIVSNRNGSLRVLTSFPLGPITCTLGMPQKLEKWSNDQVLGFVRLMWNRQYESRLCSPGRGEGVSNCNGNKESVGPVPPDVVAAAARQALVCLGNDDGECLRSEEHERDVLDTSPLVPTEATLFERSLSGTIQAPTFYAKSDASESVDSLCETATHSVSTLTAGEASQLADPKRKNRNLLWLRKHFHSLNEVGQLPFNYALLWQLHQYFFSPAYSPVEDGDSTGTVESPDLPESETESSTDTVQSGTLCSHPSRTESPSEANGFPTMGRSSSYHALSDVPTMPVPQGPANHKRPSDSVPHSAKRTKNLQPRIAFYPRIREKLEALGSKPAEQTLSVLLQLKYIESVLFQGRNVYADECGGDSDQPSPLDAEMILLDLL